MTTDDSKAALAAALNSPEVVRIVSDEFVASVKEGRALDTLKEATAALAALDGWTLVPVGTAAVDVQRSYEAEIARLRHAIVQASIWMGQGYFVKAHDHLIAALAPAPSEPD
jgi:hypothetical protein